MPALLKKTVLIVDDDPDTLKLISDLLEEQSFQCETARTASEGLEKAAYLKPDLILLDLMLPGMSGFGFMRQIRHQSQTRQIPVIILSALDDEEISQESLNLGALSYLSKTGSNQRLVSIVQECIQ